MNTNVIAFHQGSKAIGLVGSEHQVIDLIHERVRRTEANAAKQRRLHDALRLQATAPSDPQTS